nr:MAG TPA: hypothetical protein [Caudoviricetes sp.]
MTRETSLPTRFVALVCGMGLFGDITQSVPLPFQLGKSQTRCAQGLLASIERYLNLMNVVSLSLEIGYYW